MLVLKSQRWNASVLVELFQDGVVGQNSIRRLVEHGYPIGTADGCTPRPAGRANRSGQRDGGPVSRSISRVPNRASSVSPGDREDERARLRRAADIAVVETTDKGQGEDAAVRRWFDRARLGRILLEGEVSARPVVVPKVGSETTTKVSLVRMITWSRSSRRIVTITRSAKGFWQSKRGAARTSAMPMPSTLRRNSAP